MLVEQFGMDYVERGELRTKFIKPVPARDDRRVPGPRAVGRAVAGGGRAYMLDVWCEDEHGVKVVDGDARVELPA